MYYSNKSVLVVCRLIFLWMLSMTILFSSIFSQNQSSFFRFGPHPELTILSITIDNYLKYSCVICYSMLNTIMRTLNANIIQPWIMHNIHNIESDRPLIVNKKHAYEINTASNIYTWFDYLIYINLLIAQFDLFLIESSTDVIANIFVTKWYLNGGGNINNAYNVIH
jgi:hypothetical protein